MDSIELFPHNEEAFIALDNKTNESNFAFLERATGTGKSFILIKYMATRLINKRVLFVTLHDSMFNQLSNRDMPSLGVSKSDFKRLDCVLYSSINKHDASWYFDNYDVFIFDEAHHCGAKKWGQVIGELRDLVRESDNKKMIGVTATSTRYLDNNLNVCDEYFDSSLCSELGIAEAILREILPAPYYINMNTTVNNLIESCSNQLNKLPKSSELNNLSEEVLKMSKNVKNNEELSILLKKHNVKCGEKYIVFCSNINDLELKKRESYDWFKDIGSVTMYEAHTYQTQGKNNEAIKKFENDNSNNIKLMFAIDLFNEGIHIKDVDGLIMCRKTKSPILYLQQLGRALSFSSRRNQIKIFDVVGNATNIEIIYDLYKEMLAKAYEIKLQSSDNRHIDEVISRFKIIDDSSHLIDRLSEINNYLDVNFIKRKIIDKLIYELKVYSMTIDCNFMDLIKQKKLDDAHLDKYKKLKSYINVISYEQFVELANIGILLTEEASSDEFFEKLKKYGNYHNLEKHEFLDVIFEYKKFYLDNKRRPNSQNLEEKSIYNKYRDYLCKFSSKSYFKQIIRELPYVLNVEEKLLIRDYPSTEELNAYDNSIAYKLLNGIRIDALELATIKRIKNRRLLLNSPIFDGISTGMQGSLDERILLIEDYKQNFPEETFENYRNNLFDSKIRNALNYIYKYCDYITNDQFKKLLMLNIKLPKEINMTMEKRLSILGSFQSFHDKKVFDNLSNLKKIENFICEHKRRPDINSEEDIYKLYRKMVFNNNINYSKRICKALTENDIALTLDEKLASRTNFSENELDNIYNSLLENLCFENFNDFNLSLLKQKVRVLYSNKIIDEAFSTLCNKTLNLINYFLDDVDDKNRFKENLSRNLTLIPYSAIPYLKQKYDISYGKVIKHSNYQGNYFNIAHDKYEKNLERYKKYYNYLEENGRRPDDSSFLFRDYRKFLFSCSQNDKVLYLSKFNKLGIPLTLEETYLISNISDEELEVLNKELVDKQKKFIPLDEIDEMILEKTTNILMIKKYMSNTSWLEVDDETRRENRKILSSFKSSKTSPINELNSKFKDNVLKKYYQLIDFDPFKKIDFSDNFLPDSEIRKLEDYQLIVSSKKFIENLILRMEKENASYDDILSDNEKIELSKSKKILLNNNFKRLIGTLNQINDKINLKKLNIDVDLVLSRYYDFIDKYNRLPDVDSRRQEEQQLASEYDIILKLVSVDEKRKILYTIRNKFEKFKKNDFFTNYVNFIEENKRIPNKLSDLQYELDLVDEYQRNMTKLTNEQKKIIKNLQTKYLKNNIEYIRERKK